MLPRHVRTPWERGGYIEYLHAFTFCKVTQDFYGKPLISSGCFSTYRDRRGPGGLFFVALGLLMPLVELVNALRGRSSAARWRVVGRQLAMSLGIVVVVDRTFWLANVLLGITVAAAAPLGSAARSGVDVADLALPVTPVALATAVLAWLPAVASLTRHVVPTRPLDHAEPLPQPLVVDDLAAMSLVD